MKRIIYAFLLLALLGMTFLAGNWYRFRSASGDTVRGRKVLYYVDPMNPGHTSEKPGIAPCGMKMEPVYADDGPQTGQSPGAALPPMPPGTVKITPEKQQTIGVTTAVVEKGAMDHVIRTVGRVAADETRTYRLVAAVDGWIRETYDNGTGSEVKKDQKLAAFYNLQFRPALNSFFSALASFDRIPTERSASPQDQIARVNMQTFIDSLEAVGVSKSQIKELRDTRKITDDIYIVAPATGFIVSRNVSPGQQFEKGAEWYRIADMRKIWVLADLFRNDAEYVKPGTMARVMVPHERKEFRAAVARVLPQFDPNSRTLKVRLEMDNPGFMLKPDMFVDVEFPVTVPPTITIPADAVLDAGLKKTVFVDRGNGFFESRQVETGRRAGDRIEVVRGLMEGDRIVVSGNFLIDSESRMKMAAAGMQTVPQGTQTERAKDPVCGMEVDGPSAKSHGMVAGVQGKTYYFCSDQCKAAFQKEPRRYLGVVDSTPVSTAMSRVSPKASTRFTRAPAVKSSALVKPAESDTKRSNDHTDADHGSMP